MPTYRFKNLNSEDEYDKTMSIDEREKYLKTHPLVTQIIVPIALAGDHLMGVGPKVDSGFNERLGQIDEAHPTSPLADRYGSGKTNAQIKAKGIVDKHNK